MTEKQIRDLKLGDVIRNKGTLNVYFVVGYDRFGDAVAVRDLTVTNPDEWEFMKIKQKLPNWVKEKQIG